MRLEGKNVIYEEKLSFGAGLMERVIENSGNAWYNDMRAVDMPDKSEIDLMF